MTCTSIQRVNPDVADQVDFEPIEESQSLRGSSERNWCSRRGFPPSSAGEQRDDTIGSESFEKIMVKAAESHLIEMVRYTATLVAHALGTMESCFETILTERDS